jgi:hypothetical protein
MRIQEANELSFTKGKQIAAINAGTTLNIDAWAKPYEDADNQIVERTEFGASIFEAIAPKEEKKT